MKTLVSGLNNKLRRAKDRHGLQEDSFEKNDPERPKEDIIKKQWLVTLDDTLIRSGICDHSPRQRREYLGQWT